MDPTFYYKQSSYNMRCFVGKELNNLISEKSIVLSNCLNFYTSKYSKQNSSDVVLFNENEFQKKVCSSLFMQYITEFTKGEMSLEENITLQFNDKLADMMRLNRLDDVFSLTSSDGDHNLNPITKKYHTLVEDVMDKSIYKNGNISFSYAIYDSLFRLKDIYLGLESPYNKIGHCFQKSEQFLVDLMTEFTNNIAYMNSLKLDFDNLSNSDDLTELKDLDSFDDLEELEDIEEL